MGVRYTQPQSGPALIDWANPITRGMVFAWIPASDALLKSGAPTRSVGPMGVGVTTNGATYTYSNSAPSFSLDNCSITALLTPVNIATTGTGSVCCGNSGNANPLFILGQAGASSSRVEFRTRDLANTDTITVASGFSAGWANGTPCVVTGTRSLTNAVQNVYSSGVLAGTITAAAASATTFDRFAIGGLLRSSFALGWAGTTGLVLIHNRALSAREVASLSANPWQVFKSPQRPFWATSAGGVTSADGSSVGSSSLTAVSAAIAGVYGTATGLASVLGAANNVFQTSGASAGSASPIATANAITQSAGTSVGVSVTGGTSQTVFTVSGSSSGVATGSGTAVSITQAAGTSSGLASATASAVSISTANGTSLGAATLSGDSVAIWQVTGSSAGVAIVYGTSNVSGGIVGAAGSSSGSSTASGEGQTLAQAIAQALGSSTASGTGVMIAASTGSAAGAASVTGGANTVSGSSGSVIGASSAQSVVVVVFQAAGMSLGASTIDGVAASIRSAIGASSGSATASGVTQGGIHYTAYGDKFNITLVFSQYDIKLQPNQYTMELQR